MKMNNDSLMNRYLNQIENYLDNKCWKDDPQPQKKLFEAMRYSLLAGGKRLRPVMVLDFCAMCCGESDRALPLAAAIEMIHTYSLIHDDLPSMDNDDYRRGRLTNHKVYGEAMAILAGDALLTGAFEHIARSDLPAQARVDAIGILACHSGASGMVGGQVLDILSEERECTEQEILDIQTRKTGGLIIAACAMGVIAGGGNEEQLVAAKKFADHLGLAFQIRDDMLDVIGNAEDLGKATGMDEGKNTYVRLYGLARCEQLVQTHTDLAIAALNAFPEHSFMEELSLSLTNRIK